MKSNLTARIADKFVEAFVAHEHCDANEAFTLFDPFIGLWTFDFFDWLNGREVLTGRGEWHFSWVLGGRVLQDVWELHSLDDPPKLLELGSTIRMYDSKRKDWATVFVSPIRGHFDILRGNRIGDDIVNEGIGRNGYPVLWIFTDIKKDSFTWHSQETRDHGRTWMRLVTMTLARQIEPPR
jgi:hypothetical protein